MPLGQIVTTVAWKAFEKQYGGSDEEDESCSVHSTEKADEELYDNDNDNDDNDPFE